MVTSRVVRAAICLGVVAGLVHLSAGAEPVKFTFRGQILAADGKPAAGATIEQLGTNQASITAIANADDKGRFSLADGFERGVKLQVQTSDGRDQATYNLPAGSVRVEAGKTHQIRLSPAQVHTFHVTRDDQPVAEAEL